MSSPHNHPRNSPAQSKPAPRSRHRDSRYLRMLLHRRRLSSPHKPTQATTPPASLRLILMKRPPWRPSTSLCGTIRSQNRSPSSPREKLARSAERLKGLSILRRRTRQPSSMRTRRRHPGQSQCLSLLKNPVQSLSHRLKHNNNPMFPTKLPLRSPQMLRWKTSVLLPMSRPQTDR